MTATAPETLASVVVETPLGFAGVALGAAGIRRATLFHRSRAASIGELCAFGAAKVEDPRAPDVVARLLDYAAGDARALGQYPVELDGYTDLQQRVWLTLRTIPAGETRSYGWLAEKVGLGRGGARAVGTINGENPVPLWLPCHRVIASDGSLGGFAGGLAMKTQLLEHEGALPRNMFAR